MIIYNLVTLTYYSLEVSQIKEDKKCYSVCSWIICATIKRWTFLTSNKAIKVHKTFNVWRFNIVMIYFRIPFTEESEPWVTALCRLLVYLSKQLILTCIQCAGKVCIDIYVLVRELFINIKIHFIVYVMFSTRMLLFVFISFLTATGKHSKMLQKVGL